MLKSLDGLSDYFGFDMGKYSRQITSSSADTINWFNIGLNLIYCYNHEEAERCFKKALESDPHCAMCYWGIGFVNGINYNNYDSLEAAKATAGYENSRKALQYLDKVTPVEKALIEALVHRCPSSMEDSEILHYQRLFSNEMRKVYTQFKSDPDVVSVFAESLMLLHPWKLWVHGQPAADTLEIAAVLEESIKTYGPHPGTHHLYIHTMELSPNPSIALPVSRILEGLIPSSGHLLHMPSHIYIQLGMYAEAIESNLKGIDADLKFIEVGGTMNFYTLYRIHNYHFVVYAAMLDGQWKLAWEAANNLLTQLPPALLLEMPSFLESFISMPIHVLVRFGKWNEILEYPFPPTEKDRPTPSVLSARELPAPSNEGFYAYTNAIIHYARGVALSALLRPREAEVEREKMEAFIKLIPKDNRLFSNLSKDIIAVAHEMLLGEMEFRTGRLQLLSSMEENRAKVESGLNYLRKAIETELNLAYDEPWGWMQPVRHALGALLLEDGRVEEAEQVYRADLKRNPENCWSLVGLSECLAEKEKKVKNQSTDEILEVKEREKKASERVDLEIKVSCFCRCLQKKD